MSTKSSQLSSQAIGLAVFISAIVLICQSGHVTGDGKSDPTARDKAIVKEIKALEGTWLPVVELVEGRRQDPLWLRNGLVFRNGTIYARQPDKDRLMYQLGDARKAGFYALDPTTTPKSFTMSFRTWGGFLNPPGPKTTWHGIYKLEGHRLILYTVPATEKLPTRFNAGPNSKGFFAVLCQFNVEKYQTKK